MKGTNLDCEQFKCCKLPHIKVWSQTKYARSHVSPTLISVRDLLQPIGETRDTVPVPVPLLVACNQLKQISIGLSGGSTSPRDTISNWIKDFSICSNRSTEILRSDTGHIPVQSI